jgi:tetratricopeptide (TPR) repeat protein
MYMAFLYCNLGEVQGLLGNSKVARENLLTSLRFSTDILSKSPEHFTARSNQGRTFMVLAELLDRNGDSAGALENFRQAISILEVEPVRSDEPQPVSKGVRRDG